MSSTENTPRVEDNLIAVETQIVDESAGLPQLDHTSFASQLFWLFVVFFVLYYMMARHLIPRIHTVIENRQQRIEYDLDRAASLKAEAEHARESYEQALADARSQAQKMLSEVSEAIRETSEQKHRELDQILNEKISESEHIITEARLAADRDLEPTAAEVACTLTEALTGQSCKQSEMQKIIASHNRSNHDLGKRAA